MADPWFDVATLEHFWIRRRFTVLQKVAGYLLSRASEMSEIGCGHGLLQRQIEDVYRHDLTGFDLNEYALERNISQRSRLYCYDIFSRDPAFRARFDLIFLFDVLEHIREEGEFLKAVEFHLAPGGKLILNVPAGQWAYSAYDWAVGHLRRYSIRTLRGAASRGGFQTADWTYWGLPFIPVLAVRKLWLAGSENKQKIVSTGMDSRTPGFNSTLRFLSACEIVPQRLAGASLMAVLQRENRE
jgi:SAM-dependent methyltransferase